MPKNHKSNPFPLELSNGKIIIDEVCVCGFKRTEHQARFGFGHGPGPSPSGCIQFTWKEYVFRDGDT